MFQRSVKHSLAKLIKFVCRDVGLEAKVTDQVVYVDRAARVICDTKRASAFASRVERISFQMLFKTSGDKVQTLLAELVASADAHKDAKDEARLHR